MIEKIEEILIKYAEDHHRFYRGNKIHEEGINRFYAVELKNLFEDELAKRIQERVQNEY